ncbi:MAG: hypothetical protein HY778_12385 [Betaproteobacteria bacterium]|nr:hypothetical protein [Betaproteobacteria bacterium]
MDESAYRKTRAALVTAPCAFEKALLVRCADCSRARRLALAEREAVACADEPTRAPCVAVLELLHRHCAFALHQIRLPEPMPHGMEMRVQCGGLKGLAALAPDGGADAPGAEFGAVAAPADVHALLAGLIAAHGDAENLPWSRVVQQVAAWTPRRRNRGGPRP